MTPSPVTVDPQATLQEVATLMLEQDIGAVLVMDGDRPSGIITDRDIVIRALADGRDLNTPVREAMTDRVLYCFEDDSIEDVAANMAQNQVRRLPVLNRDKRLVGIVALGDLATEADMDEPAEDALEGVSRRT